MTLNKENIEEQILLYIDGELDDKAEQQLMNYIEAHPEHKAMMEAYRMTQLSDEEPIVFPDKELLLRQEDNVVPFKMKPVFSRLTAAAALALVVASSLWVFNNDESAYKPLAVIPKTAQPIEINTLNQPSDTLKTIAKADDRNNKQQAKTKVQQGLQKVSSLPEEDIVPQRNDIAAIGSLQQLTLQEVNNNINALPQEQIQLVALAEEEKNKLPQWLPINEENLQGLNDLVAKVQDLRETIQEKRTQLKNQSIVLTVAGKEFTIGNKNNKN